MKAPIAGIMGPPGSGKTTLLKLIAQLMAEMDRKFAIAAMEEGLSAAPLQTIKKGLAGYAETAVKGIDDYSNIIAPWMEDQSIYGIGTDSISIIGDALMFIQIRPYTYKNPKQGYGELGPEMVERLFVKRITKARATGKALFDVFHSKEQFREENSRPKWVLKLPGQMARDAVFAKYDLMAHIDIQSGPKRIIRVQPSDLFEAKSRVDVFDNPEYPEAVKFEEFPEFLRRWYL